MEDFKKPKTTKYSINAYFFRKLFKQANTAELFFDMKNVKKN